MEQKDLNLRILYILAFISVNTFFSQNQTDSLGTVNGVDYQKRYVEKLRQYIVNQDRETLLDEIEQESYLIELTGLVIDEVKLRNPNHVYVSTSYFKSLERFLYKTNRIILRLRENGATSLVRFAKELRLKIKEAIKAQEVEFQLERFFDRSIQLLQIAEKAFNIAGDSGSNEQLEQFGSIFNRSMYEVSDSLETSDPDIITLLSIVSERERNRFLHYVVSINYLEKYVKKIVATGTKRTNLDFAKAIYLRAFIAYEKQRYELSEKLFDVINRHFKFLEHSSKQRIEYFSALSTFYSNKYGFAEKKLERMLKTRLADRLLAFALSDVYRISGHIDKLEGLSQRYEQLPASIMLKEIFIDDEFYFKSGHALFKHKKYQVAIDLFTKISENYVLIDDANLMSTMAKHALHLPEAATEFEAIINNKDVSSRISTTASIKRAQIAYDKANYSASLDFLKPVDESDINFIEEFYTTKAWTLFILIRLNTEEVKDFSPVKKVIERFLDLYKVSDFIGEMRTLLGYVKKLEDNLTGAETEYQYVFDLKRYKRLSDELLLEEDSLKLTKVTIEKSMKLIVNRGKKSLFKQYDDLAFTVDTLLTQLKYADQTVVSPTSYNDLSKLYTIINEMERLRVIAEDNKDEQLLEVIDLKISRMYQIVLTTKLPKRNKLFSFNFFFEHSLSRKVSKNEYINKKLLFSISEIEKEQILINKQMLNLVTKKAEYRKRRNFERISNIEVAIVRLKQALQRLDFILTVAKQRNPIKNGARIDHWANFTAYELTNVQFVQKTTIESNNSEMSEVIKSITQSIKDRKVVLSQTVQTIEKTIALMDRRILKERRIAEREKVRDMFKTEFFDESSTEVNEDSLRLIFEKGALEKRVGRNDSVFQADSLGLDSVKLNSEPPNNSTENQPKKEEEIDPSNSSAINKDGEN